MARVAGIQVEKDSKGRPAYVRINLKKYPETLEFLNKVGAIEEDDFEKEWKQGLAIDEVKKEMHKRIGKWFDK